MPVALHRTYDRLYRQPLTITPAELSQLDWPSLFDKLRPNELMEQQDAPASGSSASTSAGAGAGVQTVAAAPRRAKRSLLLVTRRWLSARGLELRERVVARRREGARACERVVPRRREGARACE